MYFFFKQFLHSAFKVVFQIRCEFQTAKFKVLTCPNSKVSKVLQMTH